ncbi:Asp23/Gls24 family envelope stress response protein [Actinophytocola glycyrrhizae]|uniref:Asp23/Gls24 family envelope stress response protein n=1 Tax=Actinophytocola glycyrrhizae TaxID=2044873 RepID=A0ABV9S7F7_9PSEU
MAVNQGYALPCGRDVEDVWQHLDGGDEHDRTCPHCQGARQSLTVLRDLTRELAEDDAAPSMNLTDRIMSAVRADLRRHELLGPATAEGGVRVSAQAVAAVLRFAADGVDGVRARGCRVTEVPGDDLAIEVDMAVAVEFGLFALAALDEVRTRVASAAAAQVGVRLARFDVTVADLYDTGGRA